MDAPATREQAVEVADDLIEKRWALCMEGRCPKCEGLLHLEIDEPGQPQVLKPTHRDGCPLEVGVLEALAEEWKIPLGQVVQQRHDTNILMVGLVRLADQVIDTT